MRLHAAIAGGDLSLPGGTVQVLFPSIEARLETLGSPRVVASDKRVCDHFRALGFEVMPEPARAAATVVYLPRSRAFARQLIGQAAALSDELVIVDGQKTDGADGILRQVKQVAPVLGALSKAHGRLFWLRPQATLAAWSETTCTAPEGFVTVPGIFSAEKIDEGSRLLASALPPLAGRVVELGCGWGYLARALSKHPGITALDLVEVDARALECAKRNVPDPRAVFHWADVAAWAPEHPCASVVMNPPFHSGRAGDTALGQSFIQTAARILTRQGDLWMVGNRHLPYEDALRTSFAEVAELPGSPAFKLFHASRPRR